MAASKVIFPPSWLLEFYYYYSYFTLALCWMIAPILFYIILTQSKKLTQFKWLIINHSIWCLALETLMGLVKPVFFLPAPGGIHIGAFRNVGNFRNTAVSAIICFGFASNCVLGLAATIGSRYMLVFPSPWTRWFNLKFTASGLALCISLTYILLGITFYPILQMDEALMQKIATDFDPALEKYFEDRTFFILPSSHITTYCLSMSILIILLIVVATLFTVFFISVAIKFKSMTAAKFKLSLITSSIIQILLTGIFIVLPLLIFFLYVSFNKKNSAFTTCICMCLLMTHCLVEFLATLYFILPYRRYCTTLLKRFINFNETLPARTIRISSLETVTHF